MRRSACFLVAMAMGAVSVVASAPAEARSTSSWASVYRWVDGDTVSTSRGTVRLIGMDTPEVGQCGYAQAARDAINQVPVGTTVKLVRPTGEPNRDIHSRLLRYVRSNGVDIGLFQIRHGAAARYDGVDGYPRHPRQKKYRRADRRNPDYCGSPLDASTASGSFRPVSDVDCPAEAPIKGNLSSMIYHVPGQKYYAATHPEECFATESAAQAAGYRRALV